MRMVMSVMPMLRFAAKDASPARRGRGVKTGFVMRDELSHRTPLTAMAVEQASSVSGRLHWSRSASVVFAGLLGLAASVARGADGDAPIRLMTLNPAHFHAALFQKEMLPGVAERVEVFAPLGPDLIAHLNRVAQFNTRLQNPTRWQLEVHAGDHALERMLADPPGNVVVVSGNNQGKIHHLRAIVNRRLHVLADKPWILEPDELPILAATLDQADANAVVAYDAMTQRFEISCILPRALVNDAGVFGTRVSGTADEPAVEMESVHYFLKEVAGAPLLRPAWYFDVRQQGEGLTDVGTHLADLVQWTLFPDQAIDHRKNVVVLRGSHWPTVISQAQFQQVTGEKQFPACVAGALREGRLECYANNTVTYRLRDVFVRLTVRWDYAAAPGVKDSELAIFRGSKSRIEVRQGREEGFVPQVYVVPNRLELEAEVEAALKRKLAALQTTCPGVAVRADAGRFHVTIPDALRVGHEAHFALLTRRFLEYVRDPSSLPAWEKPNMLAKYFVTTRGVELARQTTAKP